jgi:hypothetical protein
VVDSPADCHAPFFPMKMSCLKGRQACCKQDKALKENEIQCCGESFHIIESFDDCPDTADLVPSACDSSQICCGSAATSERAYRQLDSRIPAVPRSCCEPGYTLVAWEQCSAEFAAQLESRCGDHRVCCKSMSEMQPYHNLRKPVDFHV